MSGRIRLFVGIVCALSFQGGSAAKPVAKVPVDRCSVAVEVAAILLAQAGNRKVVFSDRDEGFLFSPVGTNDEWESSGGWQPVRMPPPPAALVGKLNAADHGSAVTACPVVRADLGKRGIAFGKDAVEHATDRKRMVNGAYAENIIGFSVPVISDDGADALFLRSSVGAPLGGDGVVLHLHRDAGGRWKVAAAHQLWVS
ncbi:hypothetical protein DBR17_04275 [Sphingomonas sp. HMWF008]|nr:hypothetical protein DBR17_04275 [Sphingomonas sp. HMWF008]